MKITRRTQLLVVALVLCMTTMIGSTLAWFTDTVESDVNTIVAGNLDIELQYWNGTEYADVTEETQLFPQNSLWEPGHTEVVYLKITNAGTLALKYKLHANIVEETAGTNVAGEPFKLSDYIQFKAVESTTAIEPYATRDAAISAATGDLGVVKTMTAKTTESTDIDYVALVAYMPTTVGNEANHKTGTPAPTITLGVKLEATQQVAEKDSFGNDYDEDALYPGEVSTAADLAAAAKEGKNVILTNDIKDAKVNTTAPYGNKYGVAQNGGVIDGNGHVLDFDSPSGDNYGIMTSGGTIKNMTIGGVFRAIMIMNPTEDIYIDNVTIDDQDVCYAINTGEGDGTKSLYVSNSTIKGWNSYGNTAIKSVSFTNCTFGQGTYYNNVYGRLVKPYVNAIFDGCEFNSKVYLDLSALVADAKVVLNNCTVNGVKLTAENWTSLIAPEDTCGDGQISIEGRGGSYMTAENIFDYVIIK